MTIIISASSIMITVSHLNIMQLVGQFVRWWTPRLLNFHVYSCIMLSVEHLVKIMHDIIIRKISEKH